MAPFHITQGQVLFTAISGGCYCLGFVTKPKHLVTPSVSFGGWGGGTFDPLTHNLAPLGKCGQHILHTNGVNYIAPPQIFDFQLLPRLCKVSK